MYKEKC